MVMPIVIGNRNSCCYKCSLPDVPRISNYKGVFRYLCGETSSKPTSGQSRRNPPENVTSGLPVIRSPTIGGRYFLRGTKRYAHKVLGNAMLGGGLFKKGFCRSIVL